MCCAARAHVMGCIVTFTGHFDALVAYITAMQQVWLSQVEGTGTPPLANTGAVQMTAKLAYTQYRSNLPQKPPGGLRKQYEQYMDKFISHHLDSFIDDFDE